ncbi:hypothetical protein [Luteolibacter sp. Populi]|uniref:hypothetical protein n=1 Tax=Luteolibacter sp. Populi TaxID=3230487 RepID=UPI00346541BA
MPSPDPEAESPVTIEACHLCGQEAAMVVDGTAWCASCLHARGSCCAESEMAED